MYYDEIAGTIIQRVNPLYSETKNCVECNSVLEFHKKNPFIKYPSVGWRGWELLMNPRLSPDEMVEIQYKTCKFFKQKNYQYDIFDFIYGLA